MYMPSKPASNSPSSKKRKSVSKRRSSSASTKKHRTGSATRLTPTSPKDLNMRPNMGPNVRAPAGPSKSPNRPNKGPSKSPNKPVVKHPGRAPTERELMELRLKKINDRYNHYRRTGQYRPI